MAKPKKEKKVIGSASSTEERQAIIKATLAQIEKDFGVGICNQLGDAKPVKLERTHSGSFKIDELTGGGYPRGRIIEIFGPESSGKTTVALHALAEIQAQGELAVFIDAEHALDLNYAKALGVDVKALVLAQPDTAEDSLQICERWIRSGVCGIIVIDSVAAMVPKAELEGEIGDNHIGQMARLLSQALRKIAGLAQKTGTEVIFINQLREKVGVMFGNPETTPGGRALKFYASIRLDIRPKEITKIGDNAVSRVSRIKTVKNKVAPPFREVDVDIEFGRGISKEAEILDYGSELGVIDKSGAWYKYKGELIGQGRENAKQALMANGELADEIEALIVTMLNPPEYDVEDVDLEATDEEVMGELLVDGGE
jgi:recombination protein RecA